MEIRKPSRECCFNLSELFRHIAIPIRVLIAYLLFLTFPAFLNGCSSLGETDSTSASPRRSVVLLNSESDISSLDVFIFDADRLKRLDSYQRFEESSTEGAYDIASCSGDKIVVLLANSHTDRYEWADIRCRASLDKKIFDLESEDPDHPVMSGEYHIRAGDSFAPELTPLRSEIVIRSIKCDFSGESYSKEELTDVKVYLTNVNASCGIMPDGHIQPSRIINSGRFNEDDVARFRYPESIMQSLDSDVGKIRIYPEVKLRAYPNSCDEDSPGSPFTKIVIEGKIGGRTCYYPISINRGMEGDGIQRNRRYIYEFTITKAGLTDPDGEIEDIMIKTDMEVTEWKEKDWYQVRF